MLKIKFKYKDSLSKGNWNEQECIVSSVDECKKFMVLELTVIMKLFL